MPQPSQFPYMNPAYFFSRSDVLTLEQQQIKQAQSDEEKADLSESICFFYQLPLIVTNLSRIHYSGRNISEAWEDLFEEDAIINFTEEEKQFFLHMMKDKGPNTNITEARLQFVTFLSSRALPVLWLLHALHHLPWFKKVLFQTALFQPYNLVEWDEIRMSIFKYAAIYYPSVFSIVLELDVLHTHDSKELVSQIISTLSPKRLLKVVLLYPHSENQKKYFPILTESITSNQFDKLLAKTVDLDEANHFARLLKARLPHLPFQENFDNASREDIFYSLLLTAMQNYPQNVIQYILKRVLFSQDLYMKIIKEAMSNQDITADTVETVLKYTPKSLIRPKDIESASNLQKRGLLAHINQLLTSRATTPLPGYLLSLLVAHDEHTILEKRELLDYQKEFPLLIQYKAVNCLNYLTQNASKEEVQELIRLINQSPQKSFWSDSAHCLSFLNKHNISPLRFAILVEDFEFLERYSSVDEANNLSEVLEAAIEANCLDTVKWVFTKMSVQKSYKITVPSLLLLASQHNDHLILDYLTKHMSVFTDLVNLARNNSSISPELISQLYVKLAAVFGCWDHLINAPNYPNDAGCLPFLMILAQLGAMYNEAPFEHLLSRLYEEEKALIDVQFQTRQHFSFSDYLYQQNNFTFFNAWQQKRNTTYDCPITDKLM